MRRSLPRAGWGQGSVNAGLILKKGHKTWMLAFPFLDIVIPCGIWNWNSHTGTIRTSLLEEIGTEAEKESMLLVMTSGC